VDRARLAGWTGLVAVIAGLNYAARFTGNNASSNASNNDVYSYSTFAGGLIVYVFWVGIVLWIAFGRYDLLALRRPQSWMRAAVLALGAIAAIWVVEAIVSVIPLPESPGKEQGLTPTHWEPSHAGAFAANIALYALVEALLVLVPFGIALAWLRDRTKSVYPGMIVHGLFNGVALAVAVLTS
jgi:Type II CAAX prenyl endopeptidase Rce1-like